MKRKLNIKPIIISGLAALSLGIVTVGTTFALFTDKAETTISVNSGIVDIESEVKLVKYENTDNLTNSAKVFTNETSYETEIGTSFELVGSNLEISKMVPGDKITLSVAMRNKSNVKILYRLFASHDNGELVPALRVTMENGNSNWQPLEPVAQNEMQEGKLIETATVVIEFVNHDDGILAKDDPNSRDNKFMDKSAKYTFNYQAVQGNASVTDEVSVVNGYRISAPEGTQAGSPYDFEETVGGGLATFSGHTQDDSDVQLVVEENANGNFEFSGADQTVTYELSATNTDGNVNVSLFVGKGYADVLAYHNGEPIASTYNATTGYVTFVTDSFSPFSFALFEEEVEYVTNQDELEAALLVGGDIYIGADFTCNKVMLFSKDTKVYGLGHEIKSSANRIFRITSDHLNVKMYDAKLTSICTATNDVRGISFDNAGHHSSLLLDKCIVSASFYCINAVIGADDINITIKNGTVAAGWAAFNIYSNNAVINVENSTLRGLNDKGENSWNNFNTITFDGNCLYQSKEHIGNTGSNNVMNISKSIIYASSESGNKQYWVGIQYGAINNSIVVDKDTKIINDAGEDMSGLLNIGFYCNYNLGNWDYYENNSIIKVGDETISLNVELDSEGNLVDAEYVVE